MSNVMEVNLRLKIDLDAMKVVGDVIPIEQATTDMKPLFAKIEAGNHVEMAQLIEDWEKIKEYLKTDLDMSNISYETWIKPLEISVIHNGFIYLKKKMGGAEEYIERKFFTYLRGAIMDLYGANYRFKFDEN